MKRILASLLLLTFAAPAVAGQLEDGLKAYKQDNYETALRLIRPLADQGNAEAQFNLGRIYLICIDLNCVYPPVPMPDLSNGAWRDAAQMEYRAEAAKLLRRAADQGVAEAIWQLGNMYYLGPPVDYQEAIKWWSLGAERGDPYSQRDFGWMYEQGEGVPQNYAEAAKWYRRAADQGDRLSQDYLGTLYTAGRGVPQDYVQAHMWFNLAAAQIPWAETTKRDAAIAKRDGVAKQMSPAQIAEAQELAKQCQQSNYKDCGGPKVARTSGANQPSSRSTSFPAQSSATKSVPLSELAQVKAQIEACWNLPANVRDVANLTPEFRVSMNRDGTVREALLLNPERLNDPLYKAAADSANRALLNPRCQPLKLPLDKYDQWQTFTITFDPKH